MTDPTADTTAEPSQHLPVLERPRTRFLAPLVRASSFMRKEIMEVVRQPRMLVLLVIGPFLLLALFGVGYAQSDLVVRAAFVGVPENMYDDLVARYRDDLDDFIDPQGVEPTEAAARERLDRGEIDVIVVFPDDPVGTVMGGERAVVQVLHDEIDPLAESAIWIMSKVAVQELNATVLSSLAQRAREDFAPDDDIVMQISALADDLAAGRYDDDVIAARADAVEELTELVASLDDSSTLLGRLGVGGVDDARDDLAEARTALEDIRAALEVADEADVPRLAGELQQVIEVYREVIALDPTVVTRPFDSTTQTVLATEITERDYFVPAALALLLQHMGVTFAALSLVRDRSTGLLELLRVGPLSAWEIIIGKTLAFFVIGGGVAAALIAATTLGLGVPMVGSIGNLVAVVAALNLAALALGMILSIVSGTESQAVQLSMLSLLATLFFSGFVLSIDDLAEPVRVVSFLLPVTYGIRALQDVMFRGDGPSTIDIAGLLGLAVVYGSLAAVAFRRQLRTG
jgi:ABC-2 type transport system permease protein